MSVIPAKAGIHTILLFLILTIFTNLSAGDSSYPKEYLLSYPQTVIYVAKEPLNWQSAHWLKAASYVMIGSCLYIMDEEINELVLHNSNDFTKGVSVVGKQFGEGRFILPAMGITYATGYFYDSPKLMDTSLLCLKSFFLANGVSVSLKYLTQRHRPYHEKGKGFWNGKGFSTKRESFPSGHTTVVWSTAPIVAEKYKESRWVPPVVYTIATATSYSRMHDNKHWSSDVFIGAVIGYFTAKSVLKTTPTLIISPSSELNGIQFGWKF
ncbi:phosphatase PAP2 family protein [Candidatus Poribacteria bacterium]|nr:phosphatase PAP2 family protein [Candidatus Poribacteria bacterium]